MSTQASTLSGPDLRLLRQLRRVPQVAVARAAGWSQSRIRNVELTPRLTPATAERYRAALEIASR